MVGTRGSFLGSLGVETSLRILLDDSFLGEVAIERTHGGERSGYRRLAQSFVVEVRKEAADAM